jgi:hypothetical protein
MRIHLRMTQLVLIFLSSVYIVMGQDSSKTAIRKVIHDNQDAIDAIAMYKPETRKAIFETAEYPDLISKMNAMQVQSKGHFESLMTPLRKGEQENIWNLTRYPGLIEDLANDHKKNETEIKTILRNYPEEIHQAALDEGPRNYKVLVKIAREDSMNLQNFDLVLRNYPAVTANAFRVMIRMPEVLSTLYDHMRLTQVIGALYKKNPERVMHKTDSLNQILTRQSTAEASDWTQSLTEDPRAQKEFTEAAVAYAKDNGYDVADYSSPVPKDNLTATSDPSTIAVDTDTTDNGSYPYNWWFSYPTWDPYSSWDPYPLWYDWGFYYGPGGNPFVFGLPSVYFVDWYFYYADHLKVYPELANHYYNYYLKHVDSRFNNPVNRIVNQWKSRNSDIVNAEWDKDNAGRIQRFKQFGQMETERARYNLKNPDQTLQRNEYMQKYPDKFPNLNSARLPGEKAAPDDDPAPAKRASPKASRAHISNNDDPAPAKRLVPKASREHISDNDFRAAKQYHENAWQNVEHAAPERAAPERAQPQRAQPQRSSPAQGGRR